MKIRVLIVDDEPLARRALRQLLASHTDVEIVAECDDAIDAADVIAHRAIDVVLLDIRMPQVSGLTLASDIKTLPLVVFVTAHEEHGAAAFDTGAADYIVKPVTAERLDVAISRVREQLERLRESERYRQLAKVQGHADYLDRLVVRVGNKDVIVRVEDVELFEADDVHVVLHAAGRRYEMRLPLDKLAAQLDPARFARVHRSYLVPVNGIVAVHHKRGGESTIELRNGASVPVSRRRKDALQAFEARIARG